MDFSFRVDEIYGGEGVEITIQLNREGAIGAIFRVEKGEVTIMDTECNHYTPDKNDIEDFKMPSTYEDGGMEPRRGFLNDERLHQQKRGSVFQIRGNDLPDNMMVSIYDGSVISGDDLNEKLDFNKSLEYGLTVRDPDTGLDKSYSIRPHDEWFRGGVFIQELTTSDPNGPDTVLYQGMQKSNNCRFTS